MSKWMCHVLDISNFCLCRYLYPFTLLLTEKEFPQIMQNLLSAFNLSFTNISVIFILGKGNDIHNK